MTSIIKTAHVRHTFGNEDASGWNLPHTRNLPEGTVDLLVQIERVDGGYVLEWAGPSPEYSGTHWYIELPYAEHGAEELFGISADQWET